MLALWTLKQQSWLVGCVREALEVLEVRKTPGSIAWRCFSCIYSSWRGLASRSDIKASRNNTSALCRRGEIVVVAAGELWWLSVSARGKLSAACSYLNCSLRASKPTQNQSQANISIPAAEIQKSEEWIFNASNNYCDLSRLE